MAKVSIFDHQPGVIALSNRSWSPLIGLRRAAMHVALRMPLAIVGWALFLWVAAPVLNFLTLSMSILVMICVVMLAPGVAIGYGLSRGTTDAAGMIGLAVAMVIVIGACLSVWLGMKIATAIRPIGDWQLGLTVISTSTWATLWAVKAAVFEE